MKENHQKWLDSPRKDGGKHKDNSMRRFIDNEGKYLNRWDSLGLD